MGISIGRLNEKVKILKGIPKSEGGGSYSVGMEIILSSFPVKVYWKNPRLPDPFQPSVSLNPIDSLSLMEPRAICPANGLLAVGMFLERRDSSLFRIRQIIPSYQGKRVHHFELSLEEVRNG
jgi:hypothetical protein